MALNLAPIRAMRANLLNATEQAATDLILPKSNEYIPKDTDTAEQSGRVVRDGDRIVIAYGRDDDRNPKTGQSSNTYIEALHEDAEMRHAPGTGAFFLRRAGDEMGGQVAAYVQQRVNR